MTSDEYVIGAPLDGFAGYSPAHLLPGHGIRRRWTFHGRPRSVEWRSTGKIVKSLENFGEHATPEKMVALLDECAARGVERPSSYGDLFHQRIYQPVGRAVHRKMFPPGTVPGGWNWVGTTRVIKRTVYKYDIRSAYLWALSQGLPDPATFRTVRRVDGPGLYWVESPCLSLLPHPWNKPGYYPATEDELLTLPLDPRTVSYGVRFIPGSLDTSKWVSDIEGWSCWKAVGRSYWGRWTAAGTAVAETFDKAGNLATSRELPDNRRNPIWAAIITSRLRLRLWSIADQGSRKVFRIITDSVLTDEEIDTGEGVGDWKLEATYCGGAHCSLASVEPLARAA